ncbi:MAG TPA: hypothetical protein VI382_08820 [Candidatus Manganitrophaceae bacterium]|nr:hypothetical protein [Candidatus Manganitrophaceae bacterium]
MEEALDALFKGPPLSLLSDAAGGLFLFHGDPALFALAPPLISRRLHRGERVLFLDGDNRFDPYPIVESAKRAGKDPESFLASIFVARAFTCHQMGTLILNQMAAGAARYRPRLILLASPLQTFYDEAVSYTEASRLLRRVGVQLRRTTREKIRIVILSPSPPKTAQKRASFLSFLKEQADRVFSVGRSEETLLITEERPAGVARPPLRQAAETREGQ